MSETKRANYLSPNGYVILYNYIVGSNREIPIPRIQSFISPFIAFAMAKLDFAIICRDSFVTSGSACTSLSLFACSLSSCKISTPCSAESGGKLSLETATMLETIVMIWVRFSFKAGDGVGLLTAPRTVCMAKTMDSVWASK